MQPLIYPLWFLHDLFVLILLSPLIYVFVKHSAGLFTLAIGTMWALSVEPLVVAESALFPFILGSQIAISRRSLFELDRLGLSAGAAWLFLMVPAVADWLGPVCHPLRTSAGIIAVLSISKWLARRGSVARWLDSAAGYSFFVFAAHEPMLSFARRFFIEILDPHTPFGFIAIFFLTCGFVIGVLIVVVRLGERYVPRLIYVLTGGRSGDAAEPENHSIAHPRHLTST